MSMMVTEVYEAFIAAGVPDDKAKSAATAMSEEQLSTKGDISRVENSVILLQWMLGATFAGVMTIIFMLIELFSKLPS